MLAEFADVEGAEFPPSNFRPNESLSEALVRVARDELKWYQWRKRRAVVRALSQIDYRFLLESELTDMALRGSALPLSGDMFDTYYEGERGAIRIYRGPWTDLLDWIIGNWPAIMEMILSIISLFAAGKIDADTASRLIGYCLIAASVLREGVA